MEFLELDGPDFNDLIASDNIIVVNTSTSLDKMLENPSNVFTFVSVEPKKKRSTEETLKICLYDRVGVYEVKHQMWHIENIEKNCILKHLEPISMWHLYLKIIYQDS